MDREAAALRGKRLMGSKNNEKCQACKKTISEDEYDRYDGLCKECDDESGR